MHSNILLRLAARTTAGLVFSAALALPASAQTITLTDSAATVLRGGTYANTNVSTSPVLATRASSEATDARRILLKFDTHNKIPANTPIASARLTLTVAGGNSETRKLVPYRVTSSYNEREATWNRRKSGESWRRGGGDVAEAYAGVSVTDNVGSRVTFDVTGLVRGAVSGKFGSRRYSRILLVDTGGSSRDSYKEFYSDEAGDRSVRPVLRVTYGTATTTSAPTPTLSPAPSTSTASGTLRVLHWNTHHGGYRTDGRYDLPGLVTWIARIKPDLISLNEVEYYTWWGNEDQPARIASLLKQKTGVTWYYKFATGSGASRAIGNMVLSRYPFAAKGSFPLSHDRAATYASVRVHGRTINLMSTHLDDDSASQRTTQITELNRAARTLPEQRIIAGDFNAQAGSAELSKMKTESYDAWAAAVSAGTDIAYSGNTAGNTRNSRIDYVFPSREATALRLKSVQVYDTRDSNGVKPSDHRPLLAIFEVR